MRWLRRVSWPSAVGRLDLIVMSTAFVIFGLSLIFQAHRWHSTPAYHVLLEIFTAPVWGILFLLSGISMGVAAWRFEHRWTVITSLTFAFTLTNGWALAPSPQVRCQCPRTWQSRPSTMRTTRCSLPRRRTRALAVGRR